MLIVTILGGFALMTLGVALLLIGEIPFIAGRRISAWRSRLIGVVLVSFLPLALAVKMACNALFGADATEGPVVTSLVFSFCCLATLAILFRVMFPKRAPREPRKAAPALAKDNPFGTADADVAGPIADEPVWLDAEPPPAPPVGKKPAKKVPRASDASPFDFS